MRHMILALAFTALVPFSSAVGGEINCLDWHAGRNGTVAAAVASERYAEALEILKPYIPCGGLGIAMYTQQSLYGLKRLDIFADLFKKMADAGEPYFARYYAEFLAKQSRPNRSEAMKYYKAASDGGDTLATLDIGRIFLTGVMGISLDDQTSYIDRQKAKEYFTRCENDAAVGDSCKSGLGLVTFYSAPQDSLHYYEAAKAYPALWAIYEFGLGGITKDQKKAGLYLKKISQRMAKKRSFGDEDFFNIVSAYKKGDANARMRLAFHFSGGSSQDIPTDATLVVMLLKQASDLGSAGAAETLGGYYKEGKFVARDYVLAYAYYNAVLSSNDNHAIGRIKSRLTTLESIMVPTDISEAQRKTAEVFGRARR